MDDNNAIEELKARLDALEKRVSVLEGSEVKEEKTEEVVDLSAEKTQLIAMVPAQELKAEAPVQEMVEEEVVEEEAFHLCPNCGCEFEEGMKFCGACGSPLPIASSEPEIPVCKNCGEPLESDCNFCMNCGTKVE